MVFITISISLFLSKTDHCALPLIDHVKWLKDRLGLVFFGASQFVIPEKTWKISYRWWHNWQLIIMIWLSGLPSGLFWNTVLKCCLSRIECNRLFGLSLDYFLFVWKILYLKLVMVMVMVIWNGYGQILHYCIRPPWWQFVLHFLTKKEWGWKMKKYQYILVDTYIFTLWN